MANISKNAVKMELNRLGVKFDTDNYQELCSLLKDSSLKPESRDSFKDDLDTALATEDEAESIPVVVRIENRIRKRNVFLADSVRNDNDERFLNAEISQRKYKGKIFAITTTKYCVVSDEGEWVTTFDIEMKD